MKLLEDVWNLNDVDPISLERVSDLMHVFEYRDLRGRRFWFDALAWLDWIWVVNSNQPVKHPLTKVQLGFAHHEQIYAACLQVPVCDRSAKLTKRLSKCRSKMVYFRREADSTGRLLGVNIHAESPLYFSRVVKGRSFIDHDMREEDVDCMIACTVNVFNWRHALVNVCEVYV